MDSVSLLAWISTLSSVSLAVAVGVRRERSAVASTMLALLGALALWTAGLGFGRASDSAAWQWAALRCASLGAFAASGLWLLLALRHRFPRRFDGSEATTLVLLPAIVFFAAAMTNPSHGWAFREDAAFGVGVASEWMGPVTRAVSEISRVCGITASVLFTMAGVRLWRSGERRPGLALLLAMVAQPLVGWFVMRGGADTYPLAAASFTLAVLVVASTALRYSLLAPPPLGHRQVIDHLSHGVLMTRPSGEILDHNEAAERLLGGHPGARSIADAIASLVPSAQREQIRAELDRVERTLEPVSLQFESERHRHLEVWVRPIVGDRNCAIAQIAMLRDRSQERVWAEAALRTQQLEAMGTLAAGVAHEVNNPLAFVRANLGEIARLSEFVTAWRAERESKLADELAEMGDLAREALEGLRRIQSAVSDLQRLIVAPDSPTQTTLSLEQVARDAARLLELRASPRVEVRTRFAPDLPPMRGSPTLLVQAVLSVMLSAQHGLEGTSDASIELETGAGGDDGGVWLCVRDCGPVSDAARAQLQERLATSLAAGIAREHGGTLSVEPCEQGVATVLRFPARSEG